MKTKIYIVLRVMDFIDSVHKVVDSVYANLTDAQKRTRKIPLKPKNATKNWQPDYAEIVVKTLNDKPNGRSKN